MALYSMAIRSHDDKRLTCPYLQASQVSISNCILEFPHTHINATFLSHIDNFGSPPMIDNILNYFISAPRESKEACLSDTSIRENGNKNPEIVDLKG